MYGCVLDQEILIKDVSHVMIPANSSPELLVMMAASPLLIASIFTTESTVSSEVDIMGALGRSFDTLRVLLDVLTDQFTLPLRLLHTDPASDRSSQSTACTNITHQRPLTHTHNP